MGCCTGHEPQEGGINYYVCRMPKASMGADCVHLCKALRRGDHAPLGPDVEGRARVSSL